MKLSQFLFGQDEKLKKLENLNPQQNELLSSLLSNLLGMQGPGGGYQNAIGLLQQYLNPQSDVYKNFEQPYLDQFNQETVPMLAERFAGLGGGMGGALSSSGFGQALSSAGSNLQTNLAQMKSGIQQNSIQALLNQFNTQSGLGLGTSPFSYLQKQGSAGLVPSLLTSLAGGFAGGFGQGYGKSLGGA